MALPEIKTNHDHERSTRFVVCARKSTTQQRLRAEDVEKVRSGRDAGNIFGALPAAPDCSRSCESSKRGKGVIAGAQVDVVRIGMDFALAAGTLRRRRPDHRQ